MELIFKEKYSEKMSTHFSNEVNVLLNYMNTQVFPFKFRIRGSVIFISFKRRIYPLLSEIEIRIFMRMVKNYNDCFHYKTIWDYDI